MKYIIEIDRESIKRNPRAGETMTVVGHRKTATFDITGDLPDFFIDGENVMITESAYGGFIQSYKGEIFDDDTINKCVGLNLNVTVNIDRNFYRHDHIRIWDYTYKNIDIMCDSCEETIKSEDLKSEEIWNGADEYYSNRVCPKCGEFDCCELEYENFNEALTKNDT